VKGEVPVLDDAEDQLVEELSGVLRRLEAKGCRITVVMLPPGAAADSANRRIPLAIASRAGLAWWDLTDGLSAGTLRYTDGVHMSPSSATATMTSLLESCGR
jgi:hypothetical protein